MDTFDGDWYKPDSSIFLYSIQGHKIYDFHFYKGNYHKDTIVSGFLTNDSPLEIELCLPIN
jgi:hypothetical protein